MRVTPSDPVVSEVKELLFRSYQDSPNSVMESFLSDPKMHVYARMVGNSLAAVLVFERAEDWLGSSSYAPMWSNYSQWLRQSSACAFFIHRACSKGGDYTFESDMEFLSQQVVQQFASPKQDVYFVCETSTHPSWEPFQHRLKRLGFSLERTPYTRYKLKTSYIMDSPELPLYSDVKGFLLSECELLDLDELADCYNESFLQAEDPSSARVFLEEKLAKGKICRELSLVGIDQMTGKVVAFAFVGRSGKGYEIHGVGVRPAYRRRGFIVGSFPFLCFLCQQRGISHLKLVLNQRNKPIIQLLSRYFGLEAEESFLLHTRKVRRAAEELLVLS